MAIWILSVYALALVINTIQSRWKQRKKEVAADWPSVEGNIQFCSVSHEVRKGGDFYTVTLEYSYFVGEYRSGEYTEDFENEADANSFIESMKDKKVQISYNASKPDKSMLDESSLPQDGNRFASARRVTPLP
jgi:uncharacterized protein (DUF169 family)